MKQFCLFSLFLFAAITLSAQPELPITTASFEENYHDFGLIQEGDKPSHTFTIKNEGQFALEILEVKPSCSCITATYTIDPIGPGETGSVTVVFDASNKQGMQKKSITVICNTDPRTKQLQIQAEVE